MKYIICLPIFLITAYVASSKSGVDSLLMKIDKEIAMKQVYVAHKERELQDMKRLLQIQNLSQDQLYDLNREIAGKYRKYIMDSAIYYTNRQLQIAEALRRYDWVAESQVCLAQLYSNAGMYVESKYLLDNLDKNQLSQSWLSSYFEVYSDFYGHYGQSQSNDLMMYRQRHEAYRDSLLNHLDSSSLRYRVHYAVRLVHQWDLDEAERLLIEVFDQVPEGSEDYAITAYVLGLVYLRQHQKEKAKEYLVYAAIADIRNAVKDHASLQTLAMLHYEEGEVERAYKYMSSTIDDITFGNLRFRVSEVSILYSIINAAYLKKESKQKSTLQILFLLTGVLSLFLIAAVVYARKQVRNMLRIRDKLSDTNRRLTELNRDISCANENLHKLNAQLFESNRIKETYIAHFFDLCSTYIYKFEDYRKLLLKKATNDPRELLKILKSTGMVENERKELYKQFDLIFINLYPTFINDFNALLTSKEQVVPKSGELLNTELRIFALIRLGITDSVKIAALLQYSLSTIYNYRTKARNRAAVSRDEFEAMVMKIGNEKPQSIL